MISRIPLVIAAILTASGLALGVAGAQEGTQEGAPAGGAPTHAAHGHAHATAPSAATGDAKAQASYSLGLLLGARLPQTGLEGSSVDYQKLAQGLKDVLTGKVHPSQADAQKVQEYITETRSAAATKNAAASQRFLAENGKRPGVKTTQSGLQYKVLSEGSGASPHPTDQVTVNYRGTLIDGTVFDSSYDRGQPATFPLNKVIPGWQEALGMMKPGGKWQLFIPPELAYGANSPAPIPPNSVLKFDVELLKVAPAPAAPASTSPGGAGPNVGGPAGR